MPPPRKAALNTRVKRGIDNVIADRSALESLKKQAADSEYFDFSSPSVRKRREAVRANFEYFVQQGLNITEESEIWTADTFIERCKVFIGSIPSWSEGRLGISIKAGPLWHAKEGLYWWAVRLIPSFTSMFSQWHSELTSHIHLVATQYGLESSFREKNDLGEPELLLFFQQITQMTSDIADWKQHMLAWLLVFVTAVRPGSFTICPGYEAGTILGLADDPNARVRDEDETLRWRDVEFVRYKHGIGANVTYRYLKNHRNPYTRKLVEGEYVSLSYSTTLTYFRPPRFHPCPDNR
jgi:hypothetical protein